MIQNPTIISKAKDAEEDRSILKISILALFGAGFIFAAGHFFNTALLSPTRLQLFLSIFFSVGFLVITALQSAFVKHRGLFLCLALFDSVALLAAFYEIIFFAVQEFRYEFHKGLVEP